MRASEQVFNDGTNVSTSVKEKNGGSDQGKLFSKMEIVFVGMVVSLYVVHQTDFVRLKTILQAAMLR